MIYFLTRCVILKIRVNIYRLIKNVFFCVIQPWYRAMYDFASRTDVEISIQKGQMCKVKAMHDLDGNNEWWLVDINGKEGYAPANYLSKL